MDCVCARVYVIITSWVQFADMSTHVHSDMQCMPKRDNQIVVGGGAAVIDVPLGTMIQCFDNLCTFSPCKSGTRGTTPPSYDCEPCQTGRSSHSGSTSCFNCPRGTFSKGPGEYCRACPSGWFQPQALHPSAGCKKCPEGFYQNLTGESFCQSLQWKLSGLDCKDTEFSNDTSGFKGYWECVPCSLVDGADCHGDARWTNLKPFSSGRREFAVMNELIALVKFPFSKNICPLSS